MRSETVTFFGAGGEKVSLKTADIVRIAAVGAQLCCVHLSRGKLKHLDIRCDYKTAKDYMDWARK